MQKIDDGAGLALVVDTDEISGYAPIPVRQRVRVETPLETVRDCEVTVSVEHGDLTMGLHTAMAGGEGE
jgi:hypothetical protein